MANPGRTDWVKLAEARGIDLTEPSCRRLESLEYTMKLLSAMIDWKEEPVSVFRLEAESEGDQ